MGAVAARDLSQKQHAIMRNFPVVAHFRYLLEAIGPELRQYIVTSNDEERPFSRDQRRWVYASAKLREQLLRLRHRQRPRDAERLPDHQAPHLRRRSHRPPRRTPARRPRSRPPRSWVARGGGPRRSARVGRQHLGDELRVALGQRRRGAQRGRRDWRAACTTPARAGSRRYHRQGGDLVFQIGTAYFGCRDDDGNFDLERLKDLVASAPVKAIEIKLSQGAKPGLGGMLPAAKVTQEIAEIRGIPPGVDCASPVTAPRLQRRRLDARLRRDGRRRDRAAGRDQVGGRQHGLLGRADRGDGSRPHGRLRHRRRRRGRHRRGAAGLRRLRRVAVPGRLLQGLQALRRGRDVPTTSPSSGRASSDCPTTRWSRSRSACDMVNVGREAMLAIGCIQAQKCHTDQCPTGVATQDAWLMQGLDPSSRQRGVPTTSRRCVATCSRSPRPSASPTRA